MVILLGRTKEMGTGFNLERGGESGRVVVVVLVATALLLLDCVPCHV